MDKSEHTEDPSVEHEHELGSLASVETAYPDGGWRAWLTVGGAFLALLCTFGQLTSFGTFQTWYSEHQLSHLPPSTISWIGALQLWVFFFSGGFVGRFFDAYGPRVLMIPGTAILVFSIMITSVCKEYYQYILGQGVLFGLGVGLLFYPSLSAISTHFRKYRATALGIALAGSGVGGVVYPIMLQRLFTACGFQWGVRISGFIALALCSTACALVNSRLTRLPPTESWFQLKHFCDAKFMLLVIGSMFVSLGLFIPNFYIVTYAVTRNINPTTAFYVLAVLNAGGTVGRILPAVLSDSFGRFNLLVPCAFLTGLSTLVFWSFANTLVSIMLYAAVYGFFSGAFNALIVPCIAQISHIREIGMRIGMLYSILAFPSLAGEPAAGALLKLCHGSYIGMIVLSGTSVMVGSFFMLWSRLRIDSRIRIRV
ncbi:MFS general substrate transporter [Trametopsis cervina]|nr:MFS general substrate transporter [Trametopsis cervina]